MQRFLGPASRVLIEGTTHRELWSSLLPPQFSPSPEGFPGRKGIHVDSDRLGILAVLLSSCVTLGESPTLFEPRFLKMQGKQCPSHRLQVRHEY